MQSKTESVAFNELIRFTQDHEYDTHCYLHVYDGGLAHFFSLSKTFISTVSDHFKVTDMQCIQLERFMKAYPDYDSYHAIVTYDSVNQLFSVQHQTIDHTGAMNGDIYDSESYFDIELNPVFLKAV